MAYDTLPAEMRRPDEFPFRLAVPSWVWPGTVADNCRRLGFTFNEVGLTMFESQACMDYGPDDLPPELVELGLRYHMHMPLDLPWSEGMLAVGDVIDCLVEKTAYLQPWGYVLHPPPVSKLLDEVAFRFINKGIKPDRVLLENTKEFDPLEYWCDIRYLGLNLCLDLGHLLLYGQERLVELPRLWNRVKLVHLSAPGPDGEHLALNELDAEGRRLVRLILDKMGPDTVVMAEVFDPERLILSLEALYGIMTERGGR
ncbi:cobamide remodeling phosphodiesterase CbiR [Desulfohalovibrio reitneri]|uniref:cobamide remodeling phosphodiesterase CbiR n=1 Tax=Desulfohalovibrio reitneri TaxID=1307759 RepID=UPI00068B9398|nr:cobamide remodeling phosphodiesterase CbiR [Desulfohalovibrio reitneri]